MGRLVLIAWRNLTQNRRRSLLVGGAIASVTVLLVLLTSLSNGVQDTMLRAVTTASTGHVNIGGFFKITSGMAAPVVSETPRLIEIARREVPEAESVVDRLRGWGKVVSPKTSLQLGMNGVDIAEETGLRETVRVASGNIDDLAAPDGALLFEAQATKLGVQVGDTLTLSTQTVRGAYNSLDVRVVAIAKDMGLLSSWNIFVNKALLREMFLFEPDASGAVQIYLKDATQSAAVAERLRRVLEEEGFRTMEPLSQPFWMKFEIVAREDWTGQKLDVTTWEDEMAFAMWTLTAIDGITFFLIGVLLVIVIVGVMNTLWMAIRERTQEIGTLRAIGMQRPSVLVLFVLEAALLAAIATLVGALVGTALTSALDAAQIPLNEGAIAFLMSDTLRLVVAPASVLKAVCIITAMTTVSALWPAWGAARLSPVTAMQHMG